MTGQTDDALVLMERALASRDPLELALAGFLSAYKGRTFDKQRRLIKHYVDWCLQNDLPPLEAKRPHIELFVRWCESQPWSESYICQHFIGVRSFYKTGVRDDVLLCNPPPEFVTAPPVHEEGQKRTCLTPLEFAAFLEASRKAGPVEHAAAALMGLSGLRVAETCSLRVSHRVDGHCRAASVHRADAHEEGMSSDRSRPDGLKRPGHEAQGESFRQRGPCRNAAAPALPDGRSRTRERPCETR